MMSGGFANFFTILLMDDKNNYKILRKILLPLSYLVILIGGAIVIYYLFFDESFNALSMNKDALAEQTSILPIRTGTDDNDELELSVDMDLMIKGLSYFNVAKNETKEEKKKYYLKTIRTLTEVISESIIEQNKSEINSLLYYHLAYTYLLFGEQFFDISLKYFTQAEILNKDDSLLNTTENYGRLYILELYEIMGSIYFQLGQYEGSIEYFNKALEQNQQDVIYKLILAQSYYKTENYEKAFEYYELILNDSDKYIKSNHPIINKDLVEKILHHICELYYLNKDYTNAIIYYNVYIEQYGDSAELRYTLGKIYETLSFKVKTKSKQKKYLSKAIDEWKKAIELKPGYGKAMLKLWRYNVEI